MPLLQVRSCPDDVFDRIGQLARAEHRSIPAQTIVLLKQALNLAEPNRARRQQVLAVADQLRTTIPANIPDPAIFVRADRDR